MADTPVFGEPAGLTGRVNVGGKKTECVTGTVQHTYNGGMTLAGLKAAPQMFVLWKLGGTYGTIVLLAGWDGTRYSTAWGADLAPSNGQGVVTPTVTYSNGTLHVYTSFSRWSGSMFNYVYII